MKEIKVVKEKYEKTKNNSGNCQAEKRSKARRDKVLGSQTLKMEIHIQRKKMSPVQREILQVGLLKVIKGHMVTNSKKIKDGRSTLKFCTVQILTSQIYQEIFCIYNNLYCYMILDQKSGNYQVKKAMGINGISSEI